MNQLPTNVQNTAGHSLELFHMNTSPLNVQKGGQSFQFTISIFSMFGISFRHHTRRNYSMNSYVQRCCHATRFIQLQSAFCNARFQEAEKICLDAKIKLKYLPPYSSDCNAIDETFEELKAWMNKNYVLVEVYETLRKPDCSTWIKHQTIIFGVTVIFNLAMSCCSVTFKGSRAQLYQYPMHTYVP